MVLETVRSGGGVANMVVRRRRIAQLHLNVNEHGLTLGTGIYICKINPGSLAAKEGNLAVGDRVLSTNNKPMDGLKSAREAMAIMDEARDILTTQL
jgi:S1-C subfamily serine protease